MYITIQETGCSMDEAIEAATGGTRPPLVPYMATGTFGLEAFDGTTKVGYGVRDWRCHAEARRPPPTESFTRHQKQA
ncbi:MAG: hypothetical protein IKQ55_02445 [Kiritimatiellae bacterium]|nr:hypothetical protein [Kiritimatiellia bacterium]